MLSPKSPARIFTDSSRKLLLLWKLCETLWWIQSYHHLKIMSPSFGKRTTEEPNDIYRSFFHFLNNKKMRKTGIRWW
ncbi:COMM domain-containing protein 6 isoform X2 [Perognathus longimembris pacificus]|uniref:COMM domain-containing protein 6 isoform X2 n=1 Tax=Perognathus longimembris pacificus TaxID=214514 RepID=UPI0020192D98|nr:COMM domain-containing protein 6 isoform X2 [Perognathus longimembris pacificus]